MITKLKAWHKTICKVMPVYSVCWKSKKDRPHIVTNNGWIGLNDNVVFIEFTGLIDKKGKDIYFGDILKTGKYTYIVRWNKYELSAEATWNGMYRPLVEIKPETECEIIGNVYENPKLLK